MIDPSARLELPRSLPQERAPREPRPGIGFDRLLDTADRDRDAAAREGNALEAVFADRDGGGQSILLPWRLFANDALSQLLQGPSLDHASVAEERDPMRAAYGAASISAQGVATAALPSMSMSMQGHGTPGPGASMITTAAGGATRATSQATATALPALVEPWQARLLRWLENADGRLVARLRDYRLDAATEARCVEQLLTFARENGLELQRVLVNAREVWRAPR